MLTKWTRMSTELFPNSWGVHEMIALLQRPPFRVDMAHARRKERAADIATGDAGQS